MTRRCFFAAAGLTVAAPAVVGSAEVAAATLPQAALLSDREAKTYILAFHTGQEVMTGLLTFARKHGLAAGQLTGIGPEWGLPLLDA